mgnify:CR=1 FL=1
MNIKETRVLMLVANGYETNEIASMMNMSSHSVDAYRKKILNKMNAKNMAQAVYNYMITYHNSI